MFRRNKPSELEVDFAHLLELVNMTAKGLQKDRSIVEEHGGTVSDLRWIIGLHGDVGDAMRKAVAKARNKHPNLDECAKGGET